MSNQELEIGQRRKTERLNLNTHSVDKPVQISRHGLLNQNREKE